MPSTLAPKVPNRIRTAGVPPASFRQSFAGGTPALRPRRINKPDQFPSYCLASEPATFSKRFGFPQRLYPPGGSLFGQRHVATGSLSQAVCSSAFRRFVGGDRQNRLKAELQTEVACPIRRLASRISYPLARLPSACRSAARCQYCWPGRQSCRQCGDATRASRPLGRRPRWRGIARTTSHGPWRR